MPGSLLGLSKVRRSESGRSDRSDISAFSADSRNSGKKVSFNRAVRVKKYPRRGDSNAGDEGLGNDQVSPEKRFWFKVYKNRHPNTDIYGSSKKKNDLADGVSVPESILTNSENRDEYAYGKLHPIAETSGNYDGPRSLPNLKLTSDVGVGTETGGLRGFGGFGVRKHSSQLPADPPLVRPNYVKKIVNKFNDEAVIKFHRDDDIDDDDEREEIREKIAHSSSSPPPPTSSLSNGTGYIRNPPEPPVDYGEHSNGTLMKGTSTSSSPSRSKRLVNGVKVIFGMTQLKKRDEKNKSSSVDSKNKANLRKSQGTSTRDKPLTNGYGILSHKGPYKTSIVLADENAKALRNASKQPKTKEAGTLTRHYNSGGGVGSNWELNNNLDDDKRLAVVDGERRNYSSQPIDVWNSGDQLVSDRSRFETSVDKTSDGRFYRSSGEQSKIWRNERRTVYEEESDSPVFNERRAKSHGDLRMENGEKKSTLRAIKSGKVLSSEELYKSPDKYYGDNKDYRYIKGRATTKDKGIQCYSFDGEEEDQEEGDDKTSNINRYRVIRSKDGYVSAFSDVPSLDSDKGGKDAKNQTPSMTSTLKTNGTLSSDAIYSLVDKSKKKKKQAYVTPTTRAVSPAFKTNPNSRGYPSTIGPESTLSGSDTLRKVKQTQKGFGFRLKKAFGSSLTLDNNNKEKEKGGNTYKSADETDDNWYDVDADVEAAEKRGKSNGIIKPQPVRSEPEDDLSSSASNEGKQRDATPSSVIREMNHKKREISYENVPHLGASHGGGREISAGSGGLWFRDAEEDYRREMAQSDVSYPSGNHVGNNNYEIGSSATLSRLRDKGVGSKDDLASSTPKSYTMDRRHASTGKKSKGDKNEVKILLNGHEIDDVDRLTSRTSKNRRSQSRKKGPDSRLPSSVQSDPVHHRGGLAAAYKARQKAALKRSNSAATTSVFGSRLSVNSPSRTRRGHSSGGSAVDSSDSDSTRRRRTLVMYIPGISHPEHRASDDDKLSRVSRTQSMYSAAKPPRYQKNPKTSSSSGVGGGGGHHGKITTKSTSDLSEEGDTITPLRSEIKRKSKSPGDSIGRGGGGRNRDLRRRHSIPKDTKFGWLKWKIKGKPAKES